MQAHDGDNSSTDDYSVDIWGYWLQREKTFRSQQAQLRSVSTHMYRKT